MAEQIVGSRFPSKNQPGQNGTSMPSSAPIDEVARFNVRNPAALAVRPKDPVIENNDATNWQTRDTKASSYPTTFGHRDRNASPAKVPANSRPVSKVAPRGDRKR